MSYGPITEEEFLKALDRLGERDVLKLVRAGAFDGDEAVWAGKWLRGERTPTSALALARENERTTANGGLSALLFGRSKAA